jgi:ribosome-binding protein aMBF1 (putative translation factor)
MRARGQRAERFDTWVREQLKDADFRKAYRQERKAVFLAYKIAKLRAELGWSQAALARRIGSSPRAVARLEGGDFEGFTVDRLEKLAEAMGMELILDLRKAV